MVRIGNKRIQYGSVGSTFLHPKFIANAQYNNIALVKLKTSFVINDEVIPACLWENSSYVPFLLQVTDVRDEPFGFPTYPIYQKTCEMKHVANLANSELCVLPDPHTSSSSMTLVCQNKGTGVYNLWTNELNGFQVIYIIGVYSRETGCGKLNVRVFTRISSHIGWIKHTIFSNV